MICQETIQENTGNQSLYCQWHDTRMNHTAPGTLILVQFMSDLIDYFQEIISGVIETTWD